MSLKISGKTFAELIKYISNPEIKKYNTNFSDELLSVEWKESELESNELENYKKKAEYYIRQHQDHLVIAKLKKNQPLTDTDVKALEEILWREIGQKKIMKRSLEQNHWENLCEK